MKNYYNILGVPKNASHDAIKKAYRLKAKAYHPDAFSARSLKNSKEQFQLINEAYQVLKNESKRRLYDHRLNQVIFKQRVVYKQSRKTHYNASYSYKPYYKYKAHHTDENIKYEKIFDNVVFAIMALAGIYTIGFGFYRQFFAPVDGVNSLAGIIIGVVFTCIIIFAWSWKLKK